MSENKVIDLIGKYDDPYAELDRYYEFLEGFVKCYGLEEHLLSFLTAYEQNGLLDERDRVTMWDLMLTIAPHLFKDVEDKNEV
ncbi:hypothetical protein [Bacillus atrophaeus]|uniref:hypothetical protein n=1 Tax=Bacillus atrophaeus TaxID=1452 RepID=UPI00227F284E|nr:hypothetical protein [Bacillus atrophaeus]MCY8934963.1 hypothetical protein [Bacillus atrophaeus]MCY8940644.1 hypothetical protein [Bacillus atrophaeus]